MTTNTNFDSKEQYLAFRNAWSSAITSKEARSHLVPPTEFTSTGQPIKVSGRERQKGWINATHIMLFNILTGRDLEKGFTRTAKDGNLTAVNAMFQVELAISNAKTYVEQSDFNQCAELLNKPVSIPKVGWHLERLLRPFQGTVTPTHLAKFYGCGFYKKLKDAMPDTAVA